MSQFYVTLPSNSSMGPFPNNKSSEYTTQLARPISLSEEYEAALTEICYPITFLHFPKNTEFVTTTSVGGLTDASPLDPRYFDTPTTLMTELNLRLPKGIELRAGPGGYCMTSIDKKVLSANHHTFPQQDGVKDVKLSPLLATVLGFEADQSLVKGVMAARKVNLNAALPETLMCYTDILESSLLGDTAAPLLRVFNSCVAKAPYGTMHTVSFVNPFYVPVKKRNFQTIDILIKDALGNNASFTHGTVTCTLHFRRRQLV